MGEAQEAGVKPADLFIGVLDFFGILLPGAVLAWVGRPFARDYILDPGGILLRPHGEVEGWVMFALAAYLLGHFASLLGAFFVDHLFDCIYKPRDRGCACRNRTKPPTNGVRIWRTFWDRHENHELYFKTRGLKAKSAASDGGAFQWARHLLRMTNAAAIADLDRIEADSKFFRSLAVVSVLSIPLLWIQRGQPAYWGAFLGIAALSFFRCCSLRNKMIRAGYLYALLLHDDKVASLIQDKEVEPATGKVAPFKEEAVTGVSAEVRWFWRGAIPAKMSKWFCMARWRGMASSGAEQRIDLYFVTKGQTRLGVKRRGQQPGIEVKGLVLQLKTYLSLVKIQAPIEIWEKRNDTTVVQPEGQQVAVKKQRWLRKFDNTAGSFREVQLDGKGEPAEGQQRPSHGCNVEITQLEVEGCGMWWTLGFEAFGSSNTVERGLRQTVAAFEARATKSLLFLQPEIPLPGPGYALSYPQWLDEFILKGEPGTQGNTLNTGGGDAGS